MNPLLLTDGYKLDHRSQYPKGTQKVFSNLTARGSRVKDIKKTVFFGLQGFLKKMNREFQANFFSRSKGEVLVEYQRIMNSYGSSISIDHIGQLHDLQYLPLNIRALPEGTQVPLRVPYFTIENTLPEFFWLVNYLETYISCELWKPITSATTAFEYRKLLTKYAEETGDVSFVPFQGHDFSFRGMSSIGDALLSGSGHLLSFVGSDTIPAISYLEDNYFTDADHELIACSVPATEHSVMCAGIAVEGEEATFKRLITEIYPAGIVSIVSDTMNLWDVLTKFMPNLKDEIMARNGKVVIRPDSGDPVDIICGKPHLYQNGKYYQQAPREQITNGSNYYTDLISEPEAKGVIELLWDTFGGTVNDKGYKVLDSHVGAIYGDSITLERAEQICERLKAKGFASTNIVFGIGSYTYEYVTRDTFMMAVKATACKVNDVEYEIFKNPITDSGMKKSAKGYLQVVKDENGELTLKDQIPYADIDKGELVSVYKDGKLVRSRLQTLFSIRQRLIS